MLNGDMEGAHRKWRRQFEKKKEIIDRGCCKSFPFHTFPFGFAIAGREIPPIQSYLFDVSTQIDVSSK